MKIKTITCHNVDNFGASLQAHALMSYLASLGHDVEVIDYMPPYIRKNLGLFAIGPKYKRNVLLAFAFFCYVVPKRLLGRKSRRKFHEFIASYMKLTQRYNTFEELNENPPLADVYFCGSDQIWNTTINNGLDPAFYLDFAPKGAVRASYAASFSISEIPQEHQKFVKSMLEKMDFISVREKTALNILNTLEIKGGVNVCDPVFLLDIDHWKSMVYRPQYSNYILVYDQENSKSIREMARKIAKKQGTQIVAIEGLYPMTYADHREKYAGPLDFLSLIAHADCVITNSFHCSAFSLIMERQFFVVNRTHQKVNSRMKDLLSTLGIADRMVADVASIDAARHIDYAIVRPHLDAIKQVSRKYIDTVLSASGRS